MTPQFLTRNSRNQIAAKMDHIHELDLAAPWYVSERELRHYLECVLVIVGF
jgi:hypothetical protein